MKLRQEFENKAFLLTFIILLGPILGASLLVVRESNLHIDPSRTVADEETRVIETKYGLLIPIFTKKEVSCFCGPKQPTYTFSEVGLLANLGIAVSTAIVASLFLVRVPKA